MNTIRKGFASDNNSGVHPAIIDEIITANRGHVLSYGADPYTSRAENLFREYLGNDTEVFFVFNGTGANVLGISSVMKAWNSILTASTSHIVQDECGAIERFAGCKVLSVDTPDGKLTPDILERHMYGFGVEHHSQPKVISITQPTEMGTIYKLDEIKAMANYAHEHNLLIHMDGARIANASVSLGLPFKTFTTDAGIDILSFGGTKNGMMFGDAVCFLKQGLATDFKYVRKQGMQLASKMRFIAAQYIAWFRNNLWFEMAQHANEMAQLLFNEIKDIKGVTVTQPVQANGVFVILPSDVASRLQKEFFFYSWDEMKSEYRLMTSWDTNEEDIVKFIELLRKEVD